MVWIFPLDKRCDFVNFYRTQITIFHWLKGGQNIYIDVNIHILEYIYIYIYKRLMIDMIYKMLFMCILSDILM